MSSYSYMTAEDRKSVKLPDKFLCRICDKPKPPPMFSNKELNIYRDKVANGQKPTWVSAKLRCRNCSGEQTMELLCAGPCHVWKHLETFSKSQRKHGDDAWCLTCVAWYEAQEPGIPTGAPPGGEIHEDEIGEVEGGTAPSTTSSVVGVCGPEGDSDSDGEQYLPVYQKSTTQAQDGLYQKFTSSTMGSNQERVTQSSALKDMTNGRSTSSRSDVNGSGAMMSSAASSAAKKVTGFDKNSYRVASSGAGGKPASRSAWAKPVNPNGKGGNKNFFNRDEGRSGYDPEEDEPDYA